MLLEQKGIGKQSQFIKSLRKKEATKRKSLDRFCFTKKLDSLVREGRNLLSYREII